MRINRISALSLFCILIMQLNPIGVNAQGLMPVPDISGATLRTEAVLQSGPAWGGRYEYRYTIDSPASANGGIWLLKVDVSAEERSSEEFPPRTFPVQGGASSLPMIDEIELLAPFDGEKGAEVVIVDQYLPLELPGHFPKLAAHEGLLLVNGEVRYTPDTSRSNGRFWDIMRVC